MKVQELPFDFSILEKLYTSLKNYNLETDILILFLKMMELSGIVWIVFYIMSLPVQVFSYFVISIIKYFRKYAVGYIGLFKKYCSIIAYLLKNI